jgi:uncharacterized protein (DUF1330 family)
MKKGYWIVRVDVLNADAFQEYVKANEKAFNLYGARFLARAGRHTVVEGVSRRRNTIIEFPSYDSALNCWNSPEYQEARRLRADAAEIDIVIVEGVE